MERTVLTNMFGNVIAEKSNNIFTRTNKLFPVRNNPTFNVVKSPDTDVLVLLVHYFPNMKNTSELWFQTELVTSTKDCRRYIPVHELCKSLSSVVREILPADFPILPAICSDRYGIVSTFPSEHTALILVFGLDRLNYSIRDNSLN
jgi:ethanolamine utilization protein EutA (predicted chaperonin)